MVEVGDKVKHVTTTDGKTGTVLDTDEQGPAVEWIFNNGSKWIAWYDWNEIVKE